MSGWVFERERESTVEDTVVAWAENHGFIARAMSYRGRRGCRDYDLYGFGKITPIEFKKSDGELSSGQARERARLATVGVTVNVISTVEDGIALLKKVME